MDGQSEDNSHHSHLTIVILNTIVSILELGFKFVPNLFSSYFDFFNYLFHIIDSHTLEINRFLFYAKVNYNTNKNNNIIIQNRTRSVNFDEGVAQDGSEVLRGRPCPAQLDCGKNSGTRLSTSGW